VVEDVEETRRGFRESEEGKVLIATYSASLRETRLE
jgi:hypothetical protein